jgi:uncharacterized membrane protein YkvA (DUF1232 family)
METVSPTFAGRMRALKRKCVVLQLAMRHERTPWYARACGVLTLLYALSPIDLIPDFIPVLGHLDDLLIVPLGIWLTLKLIPADVWNECEAEAKRRELGKPAKDWRGIVLIVFLVLLFIGLLLVRIVLS